MSAGREVVACGATILGPRIGRNVVLWTKNCRRKTRHESGRCPDHRGSAWAYGPGAGRPYAVEVDGEVHLAVLLDDLRDALDWDADQ